MTNPHLDGLLRLPIADRLQAIAEEADGPGGGGARNGARSKPAPGMKVIVRRWARRVSPRLFWWYRARSNDVAAFRDAFEARQVATEQTPERLPILHADVRRAYHKPMKPTSAASPSSLAKR